jgi:hypothetical protein
MENRKIMLAAMPMSRELQPPDQNPLSGGWQETAVAAGFVSGPARRPQPGSR